MGGHKFRSGEADAGVQIENELGIRLSRSPKSQGPDWIGSDGKTYDLIGPIPAKAFERQWAENNIQQAITEHLGKADMIPIQVKGLSPDQIARIKDFIAPLGPRVFLIGE